MKKSIYKRWDGTQEPFSLKREEILEKFMDNILKGLSPNRSMMQMLWSGFPLAGMNFRVMGLEEMIRELERQKKDLFSTYTLEKAFDQPMDDLKFLLTQEAVIRRKIGAPDSQSYEELPPGLLEKLKQLKNFEFID
ncbi:MAG: hypothetical protein JSV31_17135, partial [Desulfobacterales bacterium]